MTRWTLSDCADPRALPLADRHYNRQHVGAPQYVPPSTCQCFVTADDKAVWVSSWPKAEYTKHAWAVAWMNTLFRNEGAELSSELIREAVALTRAEWTPPSLGIVTFVNADKVRHKRDPGRCYLRAGFKYVGMTQGGLLAFQLLPHEMPAPDYSLVTPLFQESA